MTSTLTIVLAALGFLSAVVAIRGQTWIDNKNVKPWRRVTKQGWVALTLIVCSFLVGIWKEDAASNDRQAAAKDFADYKTESLKKIEETRRQVESEAAHHRWDILEAQRNQAFADWSKDWIQWLDAMPMSFDYDALVHAQEKDRWKRREPKAPHHMEKDMLFWWMMQGLIKQYRFSDRTSLRFQGDMPALLNPPPPATED